MTPLTLYVAQSAASADAAALRWRAITSAGAACSSVARATSSVFGSERDPPLVRDYRGRIRLGNPAMASCHISCEQVRSGAAGLLLRQEFTARAASLRPAILFHQFGLPLRVLLYSAFAGASPSRRVQVSFLLPQYRPTAHSDRRMAGFGEYGDVYFGLLPKTRKHRNGPPLSTRASLHARPWSEVDREARQISCPSKQREALAPTKNCSSPEDNVGEEEADAFSRTAFSPRPARKH